MKSNKIFFIGMLAMVSLFFIFDYLKSTVYLTEHHGLLIKLKSIVVILGGVIIMFFSLQKNVFRIFITIYLSAWAVYFIIRAMQYIFRKLESADLLNYFEMFEIQYKQKTQIFGFTPFIAFFIAYWLITKILNQNTLNKK